MSGEDREKKDESRLSPATLAIASVSSMAAAIFIHEVWQGGAILGAAVTPIIVAIVSESLKKPTEKLTAVRPVTVRPARRGSTRAPEPVEAQAVELRREDRFGIWAEQERERRARSPWRRLNPRHLKIALATGALAFVVGVIALTGTELVFGGSVGGSDDRTTIFRGGGGGEEREEEPATTAPTTQPDEDEPAEPVQTEPVPQEEAPTETVPAEPAPEETAPEAAPEGGTPAPAEPAPGATQPAPAAPAP